MKNQILHKLQEVERQYNIEILFAIESGSRAWGFASPDSDYDIRFVYKRKPEAYLSLWKSKDTIEFMTEDDLDGSGWDLKKATLLLAKSNASFLGWLFSPIVYVNNGQTLDRMRALANENFNPVVGFYHYHNMNKGFYEEMEKGEIDIKAFFYMMRTALCANWILNFGSIPPVEFRSLYKLLREENTVQLDMLIKKKSLINEKKIEEIDSRLIDLAKEIVLENRNRKDTIKTHKANPTAFDQFFLNEISYNGS